MGYGKRWRRHGEAQHQTRAQRAQAARFAAAAIEQALQSADLPRELRWAVADIRERLRGRAKRLEKA